MGDRLRGKVAVITGGASGIGRAIASRFVDEGALVVVGDLNQAALAELDADLGEACATLVTNVVHEPEVEALVDRAIRRFGTVDVAVNSAGLATFGAIVDHAEGDWDLTVDVCLKGVFLAMKHEARRMVAQGGGGSIVNVASLNAVQPGPGMGPYCAAKAGVAMLTKVAALELGPHGVRVNAIGPGLVDTPLTQFQRDLPTVRAGFLENTPLGRVGTTADIAAAAVFLASDESTWVSGDLLLVDGAAHTQRYPDLLGLTAKALAALDAPPPAAPADQA